MAASHRCSRASCASSSTASTWRPAHRSGSRCSAIRQPDPGGSVETVFNSDMAASPRVPVTRIDLSGYGGSNFSDWNNPFAAFAEAAKVQFRLMIGSHRPGGHQGQQRPPPLGHPGDPLRHDRAAPGRRRDPPRQWLAGVHARHLRLPVLRHRRQRHRRCAATRSTPASSAGSSTSAISGRHPAPSSRTAAATLVPYYFDADVALEGVPGRTAAIGILGYLQTAPNGEPAGAGDAPRR